MNPPDKTTDPALAYLQGLEAIVRQGRQPPLERLLAARLYQSKEVVEGLVSPPLDRHEPDASLLLYHLYQRLKDDETARDYLRRSAIDLYRNLLGDPSSDLAHAGALSRLIGYYQVATRPEIARDLRLALWGLLQGGLKMTLRNMLDLSGEDLLRANHVLDLWLAVTPPMCEDITPLMKQEISEAFFVHCDRLTEHQEKISNDEPFQLLLFSFHALLKTDPKQAGSSGLWKLCLCTQELAASDRNRNDRKFARQLRGDCAELGRVLARYDGWRTAFRKGLREAPKPEDQRHELYWQALDRLGQADWLRSVTHGAKRTQRDDLAERRARKQQPGNAANANLEQAANA